MKRLCPVCATVYSPGATYCAADGAELVDQPGASSRAGIGASSDIDFDDDDEEDSSVFVKSTAARRTSAGATLPRVVSSQVAREAELERAAARANGPVADLAWTREPEPPSEPPPSDEIELDTPVAPARAVSPRAAVPWASLSWAATLMLLIGGMVAVGLGLFTFGLLRAARGGGSAAEIAPATGPQIELPEVVEVVEEDDLGLEELPPEQPALPEAPGPVVTPTQTPSAAATQPVVEPMEPAPPPASPPSVNGSWSGTVDGRPANLTVQVDGARLSGELNLQTGPNSGATSITGTLLPNGDEWTVNITASELHYQLIGRMGGNSGSGELLIRGRNRGKWSLSR